MIYIFAALHSEVRSLISDFDLKKSESVVGSFVQFKNDDILLTLTGTGPVRVAVAVGAVLGKESYGNWSDEPITVLIGSAALLCKKKNSTEGGKTVPIKIGDVCIINKLTNLDSGRTFYPDMILKTDIPEASIITGSKLLDNGSFTGGELYDMEAAAFYEAAAEFTSPDKIHILKLISDMGEASAVTRESIENQFMRKAGNIREYVSLLQKKESEDYDSSCEVLWKTADKLAARVAIDGKFSVTMENELRQILKYAVLSEEDKAEISETGKLESQSTSHIGISEMIDGLYQDKKLPARDKRAGKEILNELRKYIQ
jgi:nucleoside phosphorylase